MAWLPGGAGEADEEPEEAELTPAALRVVESGDDVANTLIDKYMRLREAVKRGLLEKLPRGRLGEERLEPGFAVDSTFPIDGGMELIGGHLVVAVAGHICFSGGEAEGTRCHEAYARAWLVDTEEAKKQVPLRAKILEKLVALRLVRRRRKLRLLMVDGELVPYQLLFRGPASVTKSQTLHRLDEATKKLLEEAREAGVSLVGVVKRSYSRLLGALLGELLPLNDKAVMTLYLGRGEYTVLGSLGELLPRYAELLAREKGASPGKARKTVEARLAERPIYGDVTVAFYRPSILRRGGYAVRVEVLDYGGLGLERILSMLNGSTNPATGLPYPIDVVDEYTRIEARVLELLRRRVAAAVARLAGGEAARLLAHTNPEKRYIYEPRR